MEILELYSKKTERIEGNSRYWVERGRSLLKALLPAVGDAYKEFLSLDRVLFLTALHRTMAWVSGEKDIKAKAKALEEYVFSLTDIEDVFKAMEENFVYSLRVGDLERPIEELYNIWQKVNRDIKLPQKAIASHVYAAQNVFFFTTSCS